VFVAGFTYYSTAGLLPQQMEYMFTTNPIRIGVLNIVQGVGNIFGGVILGALIYKIRHVPLQFFIGTIIQTLFLGLYALITPNTLAMALVFQFFANIPFAWLTLLSNVTAGLHVPQKDLGLAYGLIGTFRSLGGSIGTAVLNVILTSKASVEIPKRISEAVIPLGFSTANVPALEGALASGSSAAINAVPGVTPEIVAAAASALQYAYGISFF
jgi:Fungal trichothecene efflux pump (TRI12)